MAKDCLKQFPLSCGYSYNGFYQSANLKSCEWISVSLIIPQFWQLSVVIDFMSISGAKAFYECCMHRHKLKAKLQGPYDPCVHFLLHIQTATYFRFRDCIKAVSFATSLLTCNECLLFCNYITNLHIRMHMRFYRYHFKLIQWAGVSVCPFLVKQNTLPNVGVPWYVQFQLLDIDV